MARKDSITGPVATPPPIRRARVIAARISVSVPTQTATSPTVFCQTTALRPTGSSGFCPISACHQKVSAMPSKVRAARARLTKTTADGDSDGIASTCVPGQPTIRRVLRSSISCQTGETFEMRPKRTVRNSPRTSQSSPSSGNHDERIHKPVSTNTAPSSSAQSCSGVLRTGWK